MSAARSHERKPSHDSGETSHETRVIQLRPGVSQPPDQQKGVSRDIVSRRAEALRLSRQNVSLRDIGERLGVSKDTARRDIQAAERDEVATRGETSQETSCDGSETPPTPSDGGRDTLVLVLDEPLRQALAVLRATRGEGDTDAANRRAARAAIRATADHIAEAQGAPREPS